MEKIFESFLQAGFECSTHKLARGKRLDLVASTRHDEFAVQDYRRLSEFGIKTVREGLRWPVIEKHPGVLEFCSASRILKASQLEGIQVIWDLLHFGWPDHLDIFDPAWVEAFATLAYRFARLLKEQGSPPYLVAPVNEISFMAWGGGDVACINPYVRNRGGELKRQLVRGSIAAIETIRGELGKVYIVSPEPVIHIAGRPDVPGDDVAAENYRLSMFEAWDMLLGRSHPELGGAEGNIDILGVNFYERNQWWNFGPTIWRGEPQYRPFHRILMEVYERYRRPIFVSETGTEGDKRPAWFAYVCEEVGTAIKKGIPVQGICLYPILNHPGWEDDRHCLNGLWDYASDSGDRQIYEPLAQEIRRQENVMKGIAI